MNSTPLVSILTPCYNSKEFIAETIESVLAQTYTNFEMIIVDDGPKEPVKDIVESFRSSKIHYYYTENGGPAKARNYAARRSSGDYVAFLDHDDLWVPQKLEQQLEALERDKSVWICSGCQRVNFYTNKILETHQKPDFHKNVFFDILIDNDLCFSSVMIKKSVFFDVGLFDDSIIFMDDRDLYFRIAKIYPLTNLSAIHIINKVHGSNITTSLSLERKFKIYETVVNNALKLNVEIPPEVMTESNRIFYQSACVEYLRMNDVPNTRKMLKSFKIDHRNKKFILYKLICKLDDETVVKIMTTFRMLRAFFIRSKIYPTGNV